MSRFSRLFTFLRAGAALTGFSIAALLMSGCRGLFPEKDSAWHAGVAGVESGSFSLMESDLLRLQERQEVFLARIGETGIDPNDPDYGTLQQTARDLTSEYEAVLANNPEALLPRLLYGRLLRRIGERRRAQEVYIEANRIDPEVAVVKQQIGNYLVEEGVPANAIPFYLAAVELDPGEAVYHFTLAELLHHFGDEFVEKGLLDRAGLEREMMSGYENAARLAPDNLDFQFRHAEAFYDLKYPDWERALAAWDRLAGQPLSPVEADAIRLHRVRVFISLGRLEEASDLVSDPVAVPLEATRKLLEEEIRLVASGVSLQPER